MSEPSAAIVPTLEGPVLLVLYADRLPMSAREVHRRARRGSPRAVLDALRRLVEQGLVIAQETSAAHLFTLNRDHIAAPIVAELAALRSELIGRLRHHISSWGERPRSAVMFGSAARADGDTASDVDLLLVRDAGTAEVEEWGEQIESLREWVRRWTGNEAAISERTLDELIAASGPRAPSPVMVSILNDHVPLAGESLDKLLRRRGA